MRIFVGEHIRFHFEGKTLEGTVKSVSDPRIVSEGLRQVQVETVEGIRWCYDGDVLPTSVLK